MLRALLDAVLLAIEFLGNMIYSLFQLIIMIPQYITYLTSLLPIVPAFATVFFTAGIALTVILFMLNRTE